MANACETSFAAAYLFGKRVVVHGQCGSGGGYLASEPYLALHVDVAAEQLGDAMCEALSGYSREMPASVSSKNLMKPILKAVRAKSQRELQEGAAHVLIMKEASGFVLTPTNNGGNRGDRKGFAHLEDASLRCSADVTKAELGELLRSAFQCCTKCE